MILIGLGANLPSKYGTAQEALVAAQETLKQRGLRIVGRSNIWLSAPVPVSDQPWYRNGVIAVETSLEPVALLKLLKGVEADFGRKNGGAQRNAPRVLDLDILGFHDQVLKVNGLMIPHPRMHERAFVLYPLREVSPAWVHPVLNRSIEALIENLSSDQKIFILQRGAS